MARRLAAGAVNSIAGGGTFLTFPGLLAAVSPVVANGTSTVALVPGSLSAAWGYRRKMHGKGRWLVLLAMPSVAGGLVGSLLVTRLDPRYFDSLVPWLILTAATLFLFQPLLIGILMLSGLGLMGIGDIHAMNGLKNFLAVCINGVSVAVFAIHGAVDWWYAGLMAPAAILGAYLGSRLAQRLDRRFVRLMVVGNGFALAGHFLIQRWVGGAGRDVFACASRIIGHMSK